VRPGRLQITFDCRDPISLGRVWAAALGYPEPDLAMWHAHLRKVGRAEADLNDVFAIEDPEGERPRLFFQRVPEPKTAKNRVHLDIAAPHEGADDRRDQIDRQVDRLSALGARVVGSVTDEAGYFVVMNDPEGNEFCVD
jgi:hypothetical protein